MIAPVAAPIPAPCPTGVSHELKTKELSTVSKIIVKIFLFINYPFGIEPRRSSKVALCAETMSPSPELGSDKDFVRACVENKCTVGNLRAVKFLARRIRTRDHAGVKEI